MVSRQVESVHILTKPTNQSHSSPPVTSLKLAVTSKPLPREQSSSEYGSSEAFTSISPICKNVALLPKYALRKVTNTWMLIARKCQSGSNFLSSIDKSQGNMNRMDLHAIL